MHYTHAHIPMNQRRHAHSSPHTFTTSKGILSGSRKQSAYSSVRALPNPAKSGGDSADWTPGSCACSPFGWVP